MMILACLEMQIHVRDASLTDQTAYQEADYLRNYQKYHQHGEFLAAQVFNYSSLHLVRSYVLPRLTVIAIISVLRFRPRKPASTDAEIHTERNNARANDNRLAFANRSRRSSSKWKPVMGNLRHSRNFEFRDISSSRVYPASSTTFRSLGTARRSSCSILVYSKRKTELLEKKAFWESGCKCGHFILTPSTWHLHMHKTSILINYLSNKKSKKLPRVYPFLSN